MPREDDGKPKRPPGRPRIRTFYNRISFHISGDQHRQMKEMATSRNLFLEDVYREAMQAFLGVYTTISDQQYASAPTRALAKNVTIRMEDHLCQTIRHTAIDLRRNLADVIETAVRLYLEKRPGD